jgi:endonuclease G, mitochondrial
MSVDPMTRARAHLEIDKVVRQYLFDPNQIVNLIDLGPKKVGDQRMWDRLAIRFHVEEKMSIERLKALKIPLVPPTLGSFETDVVVGTYRTYQWPGWGSRQKRTVDPAQARADVLRGGISISDEHHYAAGTLGGKVIDRATGSEMILSNWHVLAVDWTARPGQSIYQPGRLDGGTRVDSVATLTRDAMSANLDAAVATLTGNRKLVNEQLGIGPVTGVGQAEFGMEVVKSGRTTQKTYGRVTGIDGVMKIRYGYLERVIHYVTTISQRTAGEPVSSGGDSGSWWIEPMTRQVIGLHFAGSDDPERGSALEMQAVLDALNVTIALDPH